MRFHKNRVYIHLAVSRAVTTILKEASKIRDIFLRIFFLVCSGTTRLLGLKKKELEGKFIACTWNPVALFTAWFRDLRTQQGLNDDGRRRWGLFLLSLPPDRWK